MAELRTALELVDATLDLCNLTVTGDSPVRRGFSDDGVKGKYPVMRAINNAFRSMAWWGYRRCYYDLELAPVAGDARNFEYGINRRIIRVYGKPTMVDPSDVTRVHHLTLRSLPYFDTQHPGWRYANSGQPTEAALVSDILFVRPAPDREWLISMLCDTSPPDLVNKDDVADRLPIQFFDDVPFLASIELCVMGLANAVSEKRLAYFMGEKQRAEEQIKEISENRFPDMEDQFYVVDPAETYGLTRR